MSTLHRRSLLTGTAAIAAAATLAPAPGIAAGRAPTTTFGARPAGGGSPAQRVSARRLRRWARDTWASLVAMTDESTGLTADNIESSLDDPIRSGYTSPTNIGGYLWSAVVARELGLISRSECRRRTARTLHTLATMPHHEPSGMFYNWYDEQTGQPLTRWPTDGSTVHPFLSSVDNGWLAAGLMVAASADRSLGRPVSRVLDRMNFAAFFDPGPILNHPTGLLRGGFWEDRPPGASVPGNYLGRGPDVFFTPNHYDTTVSETRITAYIAITRGEMPAAAYFGTWRTLPEGCDWSWQEQRPVGRWRNYLGVDVFEGAYPYRGMRVVPGWGGSMFEALMPNMFVPEEVWAPRSWGVNHRLTVRAHREHGLEEAGYGFWGFSPASDPSTPRGYREFGVDAIGLNPDGYFSDLPGTNVDLGAAGCRQATNPRPTYGDGVVTPHALFLATAYEPRAAYDNLVKIQRELGGYGAGGFYDAVSRSGLIARRYLSLDQAMIMGSIGNLLADQVVRRYFVNGPLRRTLRPLLALETFENGRR
jgi:hypothetical protein